MGKNKLIPILGILAIVVMGYFFKENLVPRFFTTLTAKNVSFEKQKPLEFHTKDSLFPIPIEIPLTKKLDEISSYSGFSLHYNEKHEQANWVAYRLNNEKLIKRVNRTNKFEIDPKIKTGSASNEDYKGFGYDRGHLAPAADMAWSLLSMQESFLFSNISPQNKEFNGGVWKNLEDTVRQWALSKGEIYIVTGPVLHSELNYIGKNKVSIPEYFYKVILDLNPANPQAIGFIMANEPSSKGIKNFAVSVDSVEKVTGINFYNQLDDSLENRVESLVCESCWFKFRKVPMPKTEFTKINICKGVNPDGKQCKNMAGKNKDYCRLHLSK